MQRREGDNAPSAPCSSANPCLLNSRVLYQANLFNDLVLVERTLSSGTVVRLLIEPTENQQVRILEYSRLSPKTNRFKRQPGEEGKMLEFSKLGLSLGYDALFRRAV